ncbi:MAG: NUDIX domain-containing protein [Hyphomicrobiales bacterium]|nr:NUDIX domain-containing protein [Hyphomicrobiales bacterium]
MTPRATHMSSNDVEVINQEAVFQGYFRVDRYTLRHRLFAGGWSEPFMREVFERGHAVAVLLYDPIIDSVVLIEQFRIGAYSANTASGLNGSFNPWLIEVVAGIIDGDQTPDSVARREAVEESGCTVNDLEFICRFVLTPGVSSETITLFCGRVDAARAGGIHGLDHEHEDIRVMTVTANDVFRWLDDARITNATALIALQWFRIHHEQLRQRWLHSE